MNILDEIFAEYVRMRENGLETKEALRALRAYIEALDIQDKEFLAQQLRVWEKNNTSQDQGASSSKKSASRQISEQNPPPPPPEKGTRIKPLAPPRPSRLPEEKSTSEMQISEEATQSTPSTGINPASETWVACPHCGAKNRTNEIFCYSCGQLLEGTSTKFETRHFASATDELYSEEYFGQDSVIVLITRDSQTRYEIRPQLRNHEVVIGRSSGSTAMRPDIDLAKAEATSLGVSRLHVALRYEENDNNVIIYDLGSANGSFINGQKLHPKELRVLRSGDELRLGHLVVRVFYQHPGQEIHG